MRNYYRVLGVPESAGPAEIKRAYRRLARRHHPDLTGQSDPSSFLDIQRAYETLSNQESRRLYDQRLAEDRWTTRPATDRREWFADEVAIDFPSLGDVIERIRDAFLGHEDPGALRAEILLSAWEALSGVTVPIDVPVRGTCPLCGGRGETWTERCSRCGGSGEVFFEHRVRLSVPAGVPHGARFRFSLSAPQALPTRIEVRVAIR